jgi:hypothetical protein
LCIEEEVNPYLSYLGAKTDGFPGNHDVFCSMLADYQVKNDLAPPTPMDDTEKKMATLVQQQGANSLFVHTTLEHEYTRYSDAAMYELLTNKTNKKESAKFLRTAVKPVLKNALQLAGFNPNVSQLVSDAIAFAHPHTKQSRIKTESHVIVPCEVPNCRFSLGISKNVFAVLPKYQSARSQVNIHEDYKVWYDREKAYHTQKDAAAKTPKMEVPVFMKNLSEHYIKFHNLDVVNDIAPLLVRSYLYFKKLNKRGSPVLTMSEFKKDASKASSNSLV